MNSYLNLYSPATYERYSESDRSVTGFRKRHEKLASRIVQGDRLICYLIRFSRWVGVQEVVEGPYLDPSPLLADPDPFVVRFKVKPLVWLPQQEGIPIHDESIWNALSFTKGRSKDSSAWAVNVKGSLRVLSVEDACVISDALFAQAKQHYVFPVAPKHGPKPPSLETASKVAESPMPFGGQLSAPPTQDVSPIVTPEKVPTADEVGGKESIKIQALLAEIGARMKFKIWLPKNDRGAVLKHCDAATEGAIVDDLLLGYDPDTLKTIRQIDVLWLKGKSIARAFEVEHTTAVYSGLLRMADLLALQPDINIRLHIVAPAERQKKVFDEIRRPTFVNLDLPEKCTYISYDQLHQLGAQKHLSYMTDAVLDEYEQYVPDE